MKIDECLDWSRKVFYDVMETLGVDHEEVDMALGSNNRIIANSYAIALYELLHEEEET